jgi:hypothetical protein
MVQRRMQKTVFVARGPSLGFVGEFVYRIHKLAQRGIKPPRKPHGKRQAHGQAADHDLTLPLTKAVDYFCNSHRPKKNDTSFWFRAVFGIGLLDAPMIGIELDNGAEKPLLLPWVRVLRHHPVRGQISAIDIVHKDFFQSFLRRHLSPYARQLHNRVIKHADVIAEGRGMIQHLSNSRGLAYDRAIQRQLCPSKMTAQKK